MVDVMVDVSKLSRGHRTALAQNPLTSPLLLAALAGDVDEWIRWAVAANQSVSSETLTMLADDNDRHVRCEVACNPYTPPSLLTVLCGDTDEVVRCGVIQNVVVSDVLVVFLTKDVDVRVSSSALRVCTDRDIPLVGVYDFRSLYNVLAEKNLVTANVLSTFLAHRTRFSQMELVEFCELFDVKNLVKVNYVVSNPLLSRILNNSKGRTVDQKYCF